jgi:hypothetical protein
VKCNWHCRISSTVKIKKDNNKSKDDFLDSSPVHINYKSEKTPILKDDEQNGDAKKSTYIAEPHHLIS